MSDRLAELYPAAVHQLRVGLSLPAPRLPDPPSGGRNLGSVREFYGPMLLREVQVANGNRVAFINKAFPHSRYDVMMLASDDHIHSSIGELAAPTKGLFFDVADRFVDYLSDEGVRKEFDLDNGHLHVSYNYDRHTQDRENSMFYDKRFHLHLNYWPGRDLRRLSTVPWPEVTDVALRRRLVDPIAHLAAQVVYEYTGGTVAGHRLLVPDAERDGAHGLPFGPKLRLPGWRALQDPAVPAILEVLHRAAESAYGEIHQCLVGAPHRPQAWWRPELLPEPAVAANLRRLGWASENTRDGLMNLARLLCDLSESDLARFRTDEATRIRRMTLGGLDYAISMFTQRRNTGDNPLSRHEQLYLVLQAKLFADIGGAGLPSIDAVALVRVDRSAGAVMTDADVADRAQLRQEFLDGHWPGLSNRHQLTDLPL